MPSKRKASRPAQQTPAPVASDYDTDTANLTDNQLNMAAATAPPVRSVDELNLLVLRRWYPAVERIIAIAPYAVVYNFNHAAGEWDKSDIEGSLFVCQLHSDPYERYSAIILNRKSIENFSLELVSTECLSFQSGFIITQADDDEVTGIWIFSDPNAQPSTAETMWSLIETCAKRLEQLGPGDEAENGYSYGFGTDGAADEDAEYTHLSHSQPSVITRSDDHSIGQQIDVASLFARPQKQREPPSQYVSSQSTPVQDFAHQTQLNRFTASADTDFFRSSHSHAPEQLHPATTTEQNTLLDMLRNAKRS